MKYEKKKKFKALRLFTKKTKTNIQAPVPPLLSVKSHSGKNDDVTVVQNCTHCTSMQSSSWDTVNASFLSLAPGITSPERLAAAPPCVWESVKVPLRAEWVRPGTWRAPDATAERPARRCVELASAGGSAGRGLSRSSARRRAQQNRIREASCRSYSASPPRSRCGGNEKNGAVIMLRPHRNGRRLRLGTLALTQRSRRSFPACCSRGSGTSRDLSLGASPRPASGSSRQQTSTSHLGAASSSRLLSGRRCCGGGRCGL